MSSKPRLSRFPIGLQCALAGMLIAGSVPPWGWWPLAFAGVALVDRLLATAPTPGRRFRRMWLVTAFWLYPAMLWMADLTLPGYLIAGGLFPAYYGVAAALTPTAGPARRMVMPGAFALAELVKWYVPFGGVPLANLALSQVNTPLGQTARLLGPLLIIVLVVVAGQAVAALLEGDRRAAGTGLAVVVAFTAAAYLHPRASVVDDLDVAVVQGGGPTQTRASADQNPVVLARHIEATRALDQQVELILWPENVVNPGRFLSLEEAEARVAEVAIENNATLLPGWFFAVNDDTATVNFHTAVTPEGATVSRYDKVRIVPFGEYVPLRGLIERFSGELPARDVIPGTGPAVLDTPVGTVGVAISWEAFFERRSRDAVRDGAQILTNPTNGSSFWLTQVHTQQVASNQLRAIENDRWLLMAGPTGLSAVIDADGNLLQRTGIGERKILIDTAELRTGRTLASSVGIWPILLVSLMAIAFGAVQVAGERRSAGTHSE